MADKIPTFTIQAKDNLAPLAVCAYVLLCRARGLDDQAASATLAVEEIIKWRDAHADECQDPDHKHVAA